jgi:hypothetical protein
MKKLFFIFLGILLLGLMINACRQSVEPGENGFPTMEEIKQSIYKKGYTPRVKGFLVSLAQEKKSWIKAINEIYLEHPDLKVKNSADDLIKLENLFFEKVPHREAEEVKRNNGGPGEFVLNLPVDYYLLLQERMPRARK